MDFLTIGRVESNKLINILVVTDHFTKYAQAYITPNQMAKVVAKTLWENFLVHYGWPTKILTDQGKTFESSLVKELCNLAQVRKIRTTLYRPQTNGACERFNHTLINMLGTLPNELKKNWQEWVSTQTHPYNCMVSNAIGFKPYFLMYGHEPQLAIDIEYGVKLPNLTNSNQWNYAKKLEAHLKWAFGRAKDYNEKEMNHHKVYYDKRTKCISLNLDDIVMVRVKVFGSDRNVADKWEQNPYTVIQQMNDKPVFKVRPVDTTDNKRDRVLHQNMLFPLQSVGDEDNSVIVESIALSQANTLMSDLFEL